MIGLNFPTWLESLFLLPMTIIFIFGCIPVTIKVLSGNREPSNAVTAIAALVGIVLAACATLHHSRDISNTIFSGALVFDRVSTYANLAALVILAMSLLLSFNGVNTKGQSFAEHVFLLMMSSVGMLTLTSSGDLIVGFIGLEIMSIALYVLIALGHEQKYSKEAAFKYFILGSFASAIFLYGVALIFGTVGSTQIPDIAKQAATLSSTNNLFLVGLLLLTIGIGFKVSMFPFHAWTPDVYQGAPTSISAFMATGVKLVMFTFFVRLAASHIFMTDHKFLAIIQILAVLTMTVGNITALVQENIKRLIAYSSIAHAGYLLAGIAVAATSTSPDAAGATLFYLAAYSVMNIGAFAVVSMFEKEERGHLSVVDYAGMGYRYPFLGIALTVFMLSLAGIPPTAGFFGKFFIFAAAVKEGYIWLAVLGVINSLLSVYYSLRILVYLYMKEPAYEVNAHRDYSTRVVVFASVALTLIMGILVSPFYEPAIKSIQSLF